MQLPNPRKYKRGDVDERGYVFWSYRAKGSRKTEYWVPPDTFRDLKQKRIIYVKNWRQLNPEKNAECTRRSLVIWRKKFPHIEEANYAKKRAKKRSATPPNQTKEDVLIMRCIYQSRKRVTGCLGILMHVDHIVPLAVGGEHAPRNLQVIPAIHNLKKNKRVDYILP